MAGLLSSLKRGSQDQAQASSAATAAWLLEWNQKFEQFMRVKVDELEARVAAQQARLSIRAEEEERAWADELLHLDDLEERPGGERDVSGDGSIAAEETEDVVEDIEEPSPDYIGLMGGASPASVEIEDTLEDNSPETSPEVIEPVALPVPAEVEDTDGNDSNGDVDTLLAAEQTFPTADDEIIDDFFARELDDDYWAYDGKDDELQQVTLLSGESFGQDTGLHPEGDNLEVEQAFDNEADLLPANTGLHPEGDKSEAEEKPGNEANLLHSEDDDLEEWETELPDQKPEDYRWVDLG